MQRWEQGRSGIKEDTLYTNRGKFFEELTDCTDIYRNPEGTSSEMNEYIGVNDVGSHTFSVVE